MTDQNRYLTKRGVSCFLRESCLLYEVEHRLCPWASGRRSSLWHRAGNVLALRRTATGALLQQFLKYMPLL